MNKLKQRWGIESNFQIILILIVFALTGSTSTKLAGPLCDFLGLHQDSSPWYFYWFIRIMLIFSNLPGTARVFWMAIWPV